MKLTKINSEVLKIYKKFNPSIPNNFNKRFLVIKNLFENLLKFPIHDFKSKKIIEFGCGTGTTSCYLGLNGHKVEGYDFNKFSIEHCLTLKKKFNLRTVKFFEKEFYNIKIKKYDIVICNAVIHHLDNPYKAINFLKKFVKKNGYLILGFGLDSSNLQHNLMKLTSRLYGIKDEEIYENSNFFFKKHIDRCVKFSQRKRKNVVYDQFINPQHNYINLNRLIKIFKGDYDLYSQWPSFSFPISDTYNNITCKNSNLINAKYSSIFWSSKKNSDIKNINKLDKTFFNNCEILFKFFKNKKKIKFNLQTKNFLKKLSKVRNYKIKFPLFDEIKIYLNELYDFIIFISSKKQVNKYRLKHKINNYKVLFKEHNGLGLNFFIFKKKAK